MVTHCQSVAIDVDLWHVWLQVESGGEGSYDIDYILAIANHHGHHGHNDASTTGSNSHKSHKKKTAQGNGRGTFSINMNKHKKRSYKKYRGQGR